MSKSSSIAYIRVANEDITSAMTASEKSTNNSLAAERQDSVVWGQTVHIVMARIGSIPVDNSKEAIQSLGEQLKSVMATVILNNTVIPERGKNRDGQEFDVCDSKGVPKWSSWSQTRRIWAYLGDIAKVLANGLASELYPEHGKVCPRCEILKKCKGSESPIEAITRLTKSTTEALGKITEATDVLQANTLINALVVPGTDPVDACNSHITRLDALLTTMDKDQRDAVRAILTRLTKHFV